MALPIIDKPIYETELPSTGKKIKYTPFTVKEEKILLTAQESNDPNQIMISITQILNNCVFDIDVNKLSIFDIEYLLIILRSKSVDNIVEFKIKDPDTDEEVKLSVNLADIKIHKDDRHTNKVEISRYTLFLKYPGINEFKQILKEDKQDVTAEESYNMMLSCLDMLVSDEDEVFKFSDFSKKEVTNFVESLQSDVLQKIKVFIETMPKVRHEVEYKNLNGDTKKFVIQGTESFFI
jgi:hypothetical protein